MSLLNLPIELLLMIMEPLTIAERLRLESVCRDLFLTLRPHNSHLLRKLPWRITVDYTRSYWHQTQIHAAWVKLGYFPKSLLNTSNLDSALDLMEDCRLNNRANERHYVLVRTGHGGPILTSICQFGSNIRINLERGYLPRILDLRDTGVPAKFILGQAQPCSDLLPLESEWRLLRDYDDRVTHYHPTRGLVWVMESHRLYESADNRDYWIQIVANLVNPV
jgi:hypothetical protein